MQPSRRLKKANMPPHSRPRTRVRRRQLLRLPPQLLPLLVLGAGQRLLQQAPELVRLLRQLAPRGGGLGVARIRLAPRRLHLRFHVGGCRVQQLRQHCRVRLSLPAWGDGVCGSDPGALMRSSQ